MFRGDSSWLSKENPLPASTFQRNLNGPTSAKEQTQRFPKDLATIHSSLNKGHRSHIADSAEIRVTLKQHFSNGMMPQLLWFDLELCVGGFSLSCLAPAKLPKAALEVVAVEHYRIPTSHTELWPNHGSTMLWIWAQQFQPQIRQKSMRKE